MTVSLFSMEDDATGGASTVPEDGAALAFDVLAKMSAFPSLDFGFISLSPFA